MRLDKFLCDCACGTRSEVKKYITKGHVTVNGEVCKRPETHISETDEITFDGQIMSHEANVYFLMNKPAGVVSATRDNYDRTVIDLIDPEDKAGRELFPVGRLDKDTEGLLIITDDGKLSHRLLSPKYHVDKVYEAVVEGFPGDKAVRKIEAGVDIGDEKPTLPAKLEIMPAEALEPYERQLTDDELDTTSVVRLTIHEGRFHQVKRMMEAVGHPVIYLKRISFGEIVLDESDTELGLAKGEYRRFTEKEMEALRK